MLTTKKSATFMVFQNLTIALKKKRQLLRVKFSANARNSPTATPQAKGTFSTTAARPLSVSWALNCVGLQ
jgi:hypothetical protein